MEGMLGETKLFGGDFAPRAWAFCQGQYLSIASNSALFSILGTTYGGDGRTNFILPDLRGRRAVGVGKGPGLSNFVIGQRAGIEFPTLSILQMPIHSHNAFFTPTNTTGTQPTHNLKIEDSKLMVSTLPGTTNIPSADTVLAAGVAGFGTANNFIEEANAGTLVPLGGVEQGKIKGDITHPNSNAGTVSVHSSGGSQSFDARSPCLAMHYIICLIGIFPSRN